MRLVCLHADTVDALRRLNIQFDDLTPSGLWSSPYHLLGLTREQFDALSIFQVDAEDITPSQLATANTRADAAVDTSAVSERSTAPKPSVGAQQTDVDTPAERSNPASEAEVPLAVDRDASSKGAPATPAPVTEALREAKPESKPVAKGAGATAAAPTAGSAAKGTKVAPPAQGKTKAQQPQAGQRYGTTRLRISVAGKYTEATVANGKIVIGSRSFDSPDQAAAELTKSRGDWTFWEYYDSTDGKWRMLTRDWDSVLKSAAPGGR